MASPSMTRWTNSCCRRTRWCSGSAWPPQRPSWPSWRSSGGGGPPAWSCARRRRPNPNFAKRPSEPAWLCSRLTRGASWAQLAALLRSLLAEGDVGVAAEPEMLGGMPAGDLFALANAVAALLDAPVTIEDRNSRVLAFSGRQDEADPSRVETILGRQVPERYARMLVERGVFGELNRSDRPVYIDSLPAEGVLMPRVAVAVRAGDEMLGFHLGRGARALQRRTHPGAV